MTGSDWQNPELQMRYAGYFSWFLQDKIDRQKVPAQCAKGST